MTQRMIKLDPFILKLVREVKKRKCLWDLSHGAESYPRKSTEIAWNEIAEVLGNSGKYFH